MSNDPRFARLHSDPRFVRPKASKNKIQVDERFKSIFEDEDATASGTGKRARKVDKYGRPLEKEATSNELKRYYRMASPEAATKKDEEDGSENDSESDEEGTDDAEVEGESQEKPFVDYARGEGLMESSDEDGGPAGAASDSDSDSEGSVTLAPAMLRRRRPSPSRSPSIDLSETEPVFGNESEIDQEDSDDDEGIEATTRLAVVNMDWDHLRAADLYRVLASSLSATAIPPPKPKPSKTGITKFDADGNEVDDSYKPASRLTIAPGRLLHLRIYPSSFGAERMEREAREGPPTEVFAAGGLGDSEEEDEGKMVLGRKKKSSRRRREDDSDDEITEKDVVREQLEEGTEDYDGEALRKYQLERLRYYYAVATFDTPAAAAHVFQEINGTEFERTANVFDLQYIPDETSFEGDTIHDEATESSIAAAGASYQGVEFVTDALRHSKVKLTWDADDPHRKNKIQTFLASATDTKGKGKKDMNEDDIKAYLASSSEDEEDNDDAEEQDDFFEAAEDTKAPKGRREKLRSLFGLDGDVDEKSWDGGKASSKGAEGGMQITFAPALSGKKGKKGALDSDDEDDDVEQSRKREETAIETYKRKEKERRERKKLERKAKRDGVTLPPVGEEGPEFGGENVGPGGFDDDFFADDGRDPFDALDAGGDSGDEIGLSKKKGGKEVKGKLSKAERRRAKEAEEETNKQAQAELALLVDSDKEDDGTKHFDMRAILKAEKNKGKKARKGKKGKGATEEPLVEDNFKIDVKDDRFKSLHEDYDFAIDPTSSRFQKTRNMNALLDEGRKRRAKGQNVRAPVGAPLSAGAKKQRAQASEGDSLNKLIESVKRKAGETGGRGKRAKVGEE